MKKTAKILSLMLVFSLYFGIVPASAADYTPPTTYIYGDVDFDGAVTVKDATEIQKGVADIVYLIGVQKYLADPDAQGVSVKNATAIQKHIAGLESNSKLGVTIPVDFSNTIFSDLIPEDPQKYVTDCIIVDIKYGYGHEYTLADFPEYEFKGIKKNFGKYDPSMMQGYALYLYNQDAESVRQAIEALEYRAHIDIMHISVNHLVQAC